MQTVLVLLLIGCVTALVLIPIGRGFAESVRNGRLPVLSVPARVVAKRLETTGRMWPATLGRVSTAYYATFELESGERMELALYGEDYGMLADGDDGTLTYNGTNFRSFERNAR